MSSDLSGTTLGRYQLTELVVRRNMTEVYQAYQPDLKRDVAIKRLLPTLAEAPGALDAFVRAVRAAVLLQHQNIERVYEYNTVNKIPFKAMEFIQGPTLKDVLDELHEERSLLPLPVIGTIMSQVCSGLTFANEQDQHPLHRGITTGNIMIRLKGDPDNLLQFALNIGPSDVVLTDYGVSRVIHDAMQQIAPDTVPGLADYMAPEICAGKKGDNRSDIYALGVVLYELLTGAVPFPGGKASVVMQQHIHDALPSPRILRPDLSEEVERLVLKALAKNPNDRFYDAEAFGLAVKQHMGHRGAALQLTPMSATLAGRGGSLAPTVALSPQALHKDSAATVVLSPSAPPVPPAPSRSSLTRPGLGAVKTERITPDSAEDDMDEMGPISNSAGASWLPLIIFVVLVALAVLSIIGLVISLVA